MTNQLYQIEAKLIGILLLKSLKLRVYLLLDLIIWREALFEQGDELLELLGVLLAFHFVYLFSIYLMCFKKFAF